MKHVRDSTIDSHLESARERLEQSKKKYFQDAARLDNLVEKQKALQNNELEEMFIKSGRSYDEIKDFFNTQGSYAGNSDINSSDEESSQENFTQEYRSARPVGGKHCRHHDEEENTDPQDESDSFADDTDQSDDSSSYANYDDSLNDGNPSAEPYDQYCNYVIYNDENMGFIISDEESRSTPAPDNSSTRKKLKPVEIILLILVAVVFVVVIVYTTIVTLKGDIGNGQNASSDSADVVRTPVPNSNIFLTDDTSDTQFSDSSAQFQSAVIGSKQVSVYDTEVDLSQLSMEEIQQHLDFICSMPNLSTVNIGDNFSNLGYDGALRIRENTNAVFKGSVQLYGKTVSLEANSLDLSFTSITDEAAQLKEVLPALSLLSLLRMESCGVTDETMAEIRDSVPWVTVIWRIWFGANNAYSCLTDNETILASKPSVYGALTNENTRALKYCTATKYLDLGYNGLLTDCSFISDMKDLEVCILSNTSVDSLEPLRNCANLKLLEAGGANISDLSPLAECNELIYLNVGMNSGITDYTPLFGLKKLKKLSVAGTVNALWGINELENALSGTGCTILKDLSYVKLNNNNYYYTAIEGEWRYDRLEGSSANWEHAQATGVADLVYSENYNYVRSVFNYDAGDKAYCTEINGF